MRRFREIVRFTSSSWLSRQSWDRAGSAGVHPTAGRPGSMNLKLCELFPGQLQSVSVRGRLDCLQLIGRWAEHSWPRPVGKMTYKMIRASIVYAQTSIWKWFNYLCSDNSTLFILLCLFDDEFCALCFLGSNLLSFNSTSEFLAEAQGRDRHIVQSDVEVCGTLSQNLAYFSTDSLQNKDILVEIVWASNNT